MRIPGSATFLEQRRRAALHLLTAGLSLNEVARRLGCAASSVMRWRDTIRQQGEAGFTVKFSPGRPRRLRRQQEMQLLKILTKGAMAWGFRTELWTTQRIARVIEKSFGVPFHCDHVGRIMHRLNWSHQKPERRAIERNEEAIERWKRVEWPRVKKTPLGWVPTSSLRTNPGSS